jgi:hypothetical protein
MLFGFARHKIASSQFQKYIPISNFINSAEMAFLETAKAKTADSR